MPQNYIKLLRSGQITIPKKIRENLKGDLFVATKDGPDKIILQVVEIKKKSPMQTKVKYNPQENKHSAEGIKKNLEASGLYSKAFIDEIYKGMTDFKKGKTKELESSLFSL